MRARLMAEEQQRRERVRRHVWAATTIQRAFRRWRASQRLQARARPARRTRTYGRSDRPELVSRSTSACGGAKLDDLMIATRRRRAGQLQRRACTPDRRVAAGHGSVSHDNMRTGTGTTAWAEVCGDSGSGESRRPASSRHPGPDNVDANLLQIAALTIQLGWRRYQCRKAAQQTLMRRREQRGGTVAGMLEQQRQRTFLVYGPGVQPQLQSRPGSRSAADVHVDPKGTYFVQRSSRPPHTRVRAQPQGPGRYSGSERSRSGSRARAAQIYHSAASGTGARTESIDIDIAQMMQAPSTARERMQFARATAPRVVEYRPRLRRPARPRSAWGDGSRSRAGTGGDGPESGPMRQPSAAQASFNRALAAFQQSHVEQYRVLSRKRMAVHMAGARGSLDSPVSTTITPLRRSAPSSSAPFPSSSTSATYSGVAAGMPTRDRLYMLTALGGKSVFE